MKVRRVTLTKEVDVELRQEDYRIPVEDVSEDILREKAFEQLKSDLEYTASGFEGWKITSSEVLEVTGGIYDDAS